MYCLATRAWQHEIVEWRGCGKGWGRGSGLVHGGCGRFGGGGVKDGSSDSWLWCWTLLIGQRALQHVQLCGHDRGRVLTGSWG
jgi:hypothetical protein